MPNETIKRSIAAVEEELELMIEREVAADGETVAVAIVDAAGTQDCCC